MKVDYIALSIPIFFILIAVELVYTFYKKLNYYRINDSIANLSQGIGSQLVGIFLKTVTFFGYMYIYEHWRLLSFSNTFWTWLILFMGVDFFYYWFHRYSHQINALWAAHIVHHQSEEYNLTVALRQSWFQSGFSWIFYLPLAFVGFEPIMFLTVSAFNTLYQFWIHTRAIDKMGPLEWILNTPSHHRVHHGSNPKYIDKNHAGTLIIWDRLFGTFQKVEEEVVYGITSPLASWNPLWANFHYWVELFTTFKNTNGLKEKLSVFFNSPGWFPESMGGRQYPKEIDMNTYVKYSPAYESKFNAYIFFQFVFSLAIASGLLFNASKLSTIQLVSNCVLVMLSLTSYGALMEKKKWANTNEFIRLFLWFLLPLMFAQDQFFIYLLIGNTFLITLSFIWFKRLARN
jgi:sterol desaturase/sphingolipid hydroxylase (fatty acid hydroxylase superfamily)